ncbi:MAG: beta-L-arabinofuranosidase domain-containing protein [Thermoguttaceae bacterium]|jgi:hypothetical protein
MRKQLFASMTALMVSAAWNGTTLAAEAVAPGAPATGPDTDALCVSSPGSVRLDGELGRRISLCIRNRVAAQDGDKLVAPFRTRTGAGKDWRGEFWGKWFTSAVLAERYRADPPLRAVLATSVRDLTATQTPDGYIGVHKDGQHAAGYDIWNRKYVLLGLLAWHDLTGDAAVLEAARRTADSLLAEVGPGAAGAKSGKVDIVSGPNGGMANSTILEPIVVLYLKTGEKRYLEFAEYIVKQWTAHGKKWIERAIQDAAFAGEGHAYVCMSCFEGVCELYRATGEKKYLDAASAIYRKLLDNEIFIVGSGSSAENWFGGRRKQTGRIGSPMETCATVTWLKLCSQLLRLTGDSKIADEIEQTAYNALLGAMKPDGAWWCYFTPMAGTKQASGNQVNMPLSCCVANGPRGLLLLPELAVMRDADGPVVNLYCTGSADVRLPGIATAKSGRDSVRIEQETDYPASDTVVLKITPDKPGEFTVKLRIPAWSGRTSIEVNGQAAGTKPTAGSYAAIRRTWRAGDAIKLTLDLRGRLVPSPGGDDRVAVVRGPLVLALDRRLATKAAGPAAQVRIKADADGLFDCSLAAAPAAEGVKAMGLWAAFDVPCRDEDGKESVVTFCDFASAGNTWDGKSQFCVWLPQPLNPDTIFAPPPPPPVMK